MTPSIMTGDLGFPLLDSQVFTVEALDRSKIVKMTLPEVLASLSRDEIGVFPGLRPHQRHVWHAFLCQIATLALLKAGSATLPADGDTWRRLLLALTPEDPDGAAWALISPIRRPAFLQPPVPGGSLDVLKNIVLTPDSLDVLLTSKNHDIKGEVMVNASPEHWAYALVSLQTQEGFSGNTLYGISRMNGGFASRPGIGVVPPGGLGARFQRDVLRILDIRPRALASYQYLSSGGLGLVWLRAWDGNTSLRLDELDLYYVEICRRVRLVMHEGEIIARTVGSKVARIDAKGLAGDSGDPWTPLVPDGGARKALTVSGDGFMYHRLVPILFPGTAPTAIRPAPLQEIADSDADEGLSILARALVRGQGVTEGYHERRVPVSRALKRAIGPKRMADEVAALASLMVEDAGTMGKKVLFPSALTAFTAAPSAGERKRDDASATARAGNVVARFQELVDDVFFVRFNEVVTRMATAPDRSAEQAPVRWEWITELRTMALAALMEALAGVPSGAMRRDRTRVRAERRFANAFMRYFAGYNPAGGTPGNTSGTGRTSASVP